MSEASVQPDCDGSELRYLLFQLNGNRFATPLLQVREIIEYHAPKSVPNPHPYFAGVINLRGEIIGVIDLRIRLGLKADSHPELTMVICDTASGPLAALVDRVDSVTAITDDLIERHPNLKTRVPLTFLTGIARHQDGIVSVVNLQELLTNDGIVPDGTLTVA